MEPLMRTSVRLADEKFEHPQEWQPKCLVTISFLATEMQEAPMNTLPMDSHHACVLTHTRQTQHTNFT